MLEEFNLETLKRNKKIFGIKKKKSDKFWNTKKIEL